MNNVNLFFEEIDFVDGCSGQYTVYLYSIIKDNIYIILYIIIYNTI